MKLLNQIETNIISGGIITFKIENQEIIVKLSEISDQIHIHGDLGFGGNGLNIKGSGHVFHATSQLDVSSIPKTIYTVYANYIMSATNCPGLDCTVRIKPCS